MALRASMIFWPFLLAAACANHRDFLPRENPNGCGPGGQPAAVYPVVAGEARGEVRLWSRGSGRADGGVDAPTEVHVGFELENTGSVPLRLAAEVLQLDELLVGEERYVEVRPARTAGAPLAEPGRSTRFEAWFRPARGGPRDVVGFAVRFRIDAGERPVLVQVTPFAPFVVRDPYPYDPWFWGPPYPMHRHYHRW